MAKRFVDTGRFFDPWYRSLAPNLKVFWEFVISNCDIAGVWKMDFDLVRFILGATAFQPETALPMFNEGKDRIIEFGGGKYWYVADFISFQYGTLSADCRPHRAVIKTLDDHLKRGLPKKYIQAAKAGNGEVGAAERWASPPKSFSKLVKTLAEGKGIPNARKN